MTPAERGDAERFYELVWPHADAVLRVARILTHREADADDLAQETLLKAFRSLRTLRKGAGVKAWLMTILRHAHIDQLRSKPPPMLSLDDITVPPRCATAGRAGVGRGVRDPDDLVESFSDASVIEELRALPKEIRWTLLLADVEQLDHSDVAAVLGVPVGTVKSRVHRGRSMVRNALLPETVHTWCGRRDPTLLSARPAPGYSADAIVTPLAV